MKLYKIIIVDDEQEARTAIKNTVYWEKAGFTIIGDAENGQDALEKLEILEPDVLMTDIRMPYIDGLELAKRAKKLYPSLKIIICSGYNDFEYAKEAIRLGVSEYVLKPVNREDLTNILLKVKEKLDDEISKSRDLDILRNNYKASIPILREQFLNNLILGKTVKDEIEDKVKRYGIDLMPSKTWVVSVVDIEEGGSETSSIDKELIPVSVQKFIYDKLSKKYKCCVFTSASDTKLVIITGIDSENHSGSEESIKEDELVDTLRNICKENRKVLGVSITIAVGSTCTELYSITYSYADALNALGYKNVIGTGDILYFHDVEPVNLGFLKFSEKDESDLTYAIKFGTKEGVYYVIDMVLDKMKSAKVHTSQYHTYMLSAANCIVQLMQQYEISFEDISTEPGSEYVDILEIIKNMEEFILWFQDICIKIHGYMRERRENTTKRVIEEAKRYIQENFTNPDLSLEMICKHLHMSTAYFSTIFKKEVKQSYIAYLTDLRLGLAMELLKNTDKKTYVIANEVGYPEQNYFSYVFKRKFGMTPTKFRAADKKF